MMIQIIISAAAIFLSLAYVLYFLVRTGKETAPPLSLASAILMAAAVELFDLMAFLDPQSIYAWKKPALIVESFFPMVWLWFTLTYGRQDGSRSISSVQRLILAASSFIVASAVFFPATSFFYSPDFISEKVLFLSNAGFYLYLALMVFLIIALINIEMLLRSATLISRWKIKFELMGAGAFLAVMIFYYSQGLLFRTINMNLVPARTVVLIVALAMLSFSRLKRGDGAKVYISRNALYKSLVLLVVGSYLLTLGLIGEGMKHFGDGFQRATGIALIFIVGIGVGILLFSETAKRKFRVFVHKNFYRNKYDYRNHWLQFTERLSSSKTSDELMQFIVLGFCETFGMGCGALFLLDKEQETYLQTAEIEMVFPTAIFRVNDSFFESFVHHKWIVNFHGRDVYSGDDQQQKFFKANDVSFVIPLLLKDKFDGFVILGRPLSRDEAYNYEDYDLMKTLACQASSTILNLRLSDQLAHSREMAAIGKVSAFIMHDLKNLVSVLSLMLGNAKEYISAPEFQEELLGSLGTTVGEMNALISRLKHLPEKNSLQLEPVDMLHLARETASLVKGGEFEIIGSQVIAQVDRDEFQKVALNLMLNAVEASTGENQLVRVEVGAKERIFFRVKDEGCGIAEDYLHHEIFTPFKSTKKKGLGIGLYQCKQIIEAHGGKIEVTSEVNKGAEFTVWLPIVNT